MPKVSVIIPVYNTEKYLRKCLDSVCNQTLSDIEIICIDDCSTDNSLNILKEYAAKDERIKLIEFKENKGAAVARNTGIYEAKGEYIGFVDSDDYIDLDFYEKLYNIGVSEKGDISKAKVSFYTSYKNPVYVDQTNINIQKCKAYFDMYFGSAIYKREFLKKNNLNFLENCSWGEDRFFIVKSTYCSNKISVTDSTNYNCNCQRENSATSKINIQKFTDSIKSTNHVIDFINDKYKNTEEYNIVASSFINDLYNTTLQYISENNIIEDELFNLVQTSAKSINVEHISSLATKVKYFLINNKRKDLFLKDFQTQQREYILLNLRTKIRGANA